MNAAPIITIHLHYFALLREQRGVAAETVTSSAVSPRQLYEELAEKHELTLSGDNIGVAVNNQFSNLDCRLKDGDTVTFIPPVAGG